MRNILSVCLFVLLFGCMRATVPVQTAEEPVTLKEVAETDKFAEQEKPLEPIVKSITILKGTVNVEMEKFIVPFYGIAIRIKGSSSYIEIRKVENGYSYGNRKVYGTIDEALKDCLEGFFDKYWNVIVEEGKVRLLMDIINSFIDEEFLSAPFNDKWG